MSEPLLFVNPENGLVYKVIQAQEVNLQQIEEGITFHKEQIASLEVERTKLLELNPDAVNAVEEAAEEPEKPQADVVNPDASEVVNPETPAPSATDAVVTPDSSSADAAPTQPEAPAQEVVATPPIAA